MENDPTYCFSYCSNGFREHLTDTFVICLDDWLDSVQFCLSAFVLILGYVDGYQCFVYHF